jgi:phage-related protein
MQYWQDWLNTNMPMIEAIFNNVLGAIQRLWEIFGPAIELIVGTAFNNIWIAIDTVMRTIGDLITLALQLLTGDFEGAKATLEGIVQRTWDAISTIFSNSLGMIRQLISNINWYGIGTAIINGIADGIEAGAYYIVNAAERAAYNALQAAKQWLGIGSPSKVAAADIGEPFAEGIGIGAMRGLRDLAGKVDAGLASVMGDISAPQPIMAGAGGRAPITINITLNGSATYEDGRAVGAGVSDELRARGLA